MKTGDFQMPFFGENYFAAATSLTGLRRAGHSIWLLTGVVANRTMGERKALRANAPLFLAIVVIGLMTGPSLMYGWMMSAALNEPSTTYAVLSAVMWPAVPFYITLNSAMELLLISLLLFLWSGEDRSCCFCSRVEFTSLLPSRAPLKH